MLDHEKYLGEVSTIYQGSNDGAARKTGKDHNPE